MHALTSIEIAGSSLVDPAAAAELAHYGVAVRGTKRPATIRALRWDIARFAAWCTAAGCLALPPKPEDVAAFLDAAAEDRTPATVRRYASSIAELHRGAGLSNPCAASVVRYALKRMHLAAGRDQQQAAPISDELVVRMLNAAGHTLRDLRDKALLAVAYTTFCRRSELVELRREDLQVEADGFGTITIRRSKTDQEGAGAMAPITADGMRHLLTWIDAADLGEGSLFSAVLKGSRLGGPLTGGEVARRFKAMALQAGLSPEETARISGHSTRVGAAQEALGLGAELGAIMQADHWKSPEMVSRDTARLGARHSAAVLVAHRRTQAYSPSKTRQHP